MIGVFTQTKPCSWKNRWIAWAMVWRTRVTAPMTLVRGRRCATSRRNSKRVRLRLDRVGVRIVDPADDPDRAGLHLERLALRLRRHDAAGGLHRATGRQMHYLVRIVGQRIRRHHLHGVETRAIGNVHEGDAGLGIAPRAHPTLQSDRRVVGRAPRQNVRTSQRGHRRPLLEKSIAAPGPRCAPAKARAMIPEVAHRPHTQLPHDGIPARRQDASTAGSGSRRATTSRRFHDSPETQKKAGRNARPCPAQRLR